MALETFLAWTSGTAAPAEKPFVEKYLWAIILGGVLLLVLLLIIIVIIICCCCRRRKAKRKGKQNRKTKNTVEKGTSELDVTLVSNGHNGQQPADESTKKGTDKSTKNVKTARAAPVPTNHGVDQEEGSNKETKNSHHMDSAHTPPTPPSAKQGQGTDKTQISESEGANVGVVASSVTAVDRSRKAHSKKSHSKRGHSKKGHAKKEKSGKSDKNGKEDDEESHSSDCSCSDASLSTKPPARKSEETKTKDSMYLIHE